MVVISMWSKVLLERCVLKQDRYVQGPFGLGGLWGFSLMASVGAPGSFLPFASLQMSAVYAELENRLIGSFAGKMANAAPRRTSSPVSDQANTAGKVCLASGSRAEEFGFPS